MSLSAHRVYHGSMSGQTMLRWMSRADDVTTESGSDDDRTAVRSLLARTAAAVSAPVDVTETVRPLVDVLLTLRASGAARTSPRGWG